MSTQKIDYIARLFGESGVKRLFKLIINLTKTHGKTERTFRFSNGKLGQFEPDFLDFDYDLIVNVGLGSGNKNKEAAAIGQVIQLTEKIVAAQGNTEGPFITDIEIYNQIADFAKALGVRNPDRYIIDPQLPIFQQLKEQAEAKAAEANNQPSPEEQLAKAQIESAQIQAQAKLIEAQSKAELDKLKFGFEKELEAAEKQRAHNLQVEKMRREFALKEAELKLRYAEFGKELQDVKDSDAQFGAKDEQAI